MTESYELTPKASIFLRLTRAETTRQRATGSIWRAISHNWRLIFVDDDSRLGEEDTCDYSKAETDETDHEGSF